LAAVKPVFDVPIRQFIGCYDRVLALI